MVQIINKTSIALLNALKAPNRIIPNLKGKYINLKMQFNKSSIILDKKDLFTASSLPAQLLDKVIEIFQPKSLLDLGCGTGQAVNYFLEQRIPIVVGVEGSSEAIAHAKNANSIVQFNLNKELNLHQKFDLIFSYEFVEHIHPVYVENLMKTFSNHSDLVILSAAQPGQGGLGHFNEQKPEYWIEKFKSYGYRYDADSTQILKVVEQDYPANILVLRRNWVN